MKIKIGDRYIFKGVCQYGHTREGLKITILPNDIVIKIKDTFRDHLQLRRMYRLDGTEWEIDIDDSIIKRYFVKEE